MTEKQAIKEVNTLIAALGEADEFAKKYEPENYKLAKALRTVLDLLGKKTRQLEIKDKSAVEYYEILIQLS